MTVIAVTVTTVMTVTIAMTDQVKRTDQPTGQYKTNPNTSIKYVLNAGPFFSLDPFTMR